MGSKSCAMFWNEWKINFPIWPISSFWGMVDLTISIHPKMWKILQDQKKISSDLKKKIGRRHTWKFKCINVNTIGTLRIFHKVSTTSEEWEGGGLCMSVSGKRPRYVLKRIKNQFSVFEIWSIWPSRYILKRCTWNFFSSDLKKKIVHTFQTILRFFFNFGEKKILNFFLSNLFIIP